MFTIWYIMKRNSVLVDRQTCGDHHARKKRFLSLRKFCTQWSPDCPCSRSRAGRSPFPFACIWRGSPPRSAPPPRPTPPRTRRSSGRRRTPPARSLCSPPPSPKCALELRERVGSSSPDPTWHYQVASLGWVELRTLRRTCFAVRVMRWRKPWGLKGSHQS